MDIWGPSPNPSLHGHRYFLTIIDDFSKFCWVYLMHNKSETRMHVNNFVNLVENQFETKIKIIRSDNENVFKMVDLSILEVSYIKLVVWKHQNKMG